MITLAKESSRYAWIAEHRGGPLTSGQHKQLMQRAIICLEDVIDKLNIEIPVEISDALRIAHHRIDGSSSVGETRQVATHCHTLARILTDPTMIAVTRAAGHTVAIAHMADHSLRVGEHIIKGFELQGYSKLDINNKRKWQNDQLPEEIKNLVLSSRAVIK